ncbi:MAG: DUF4411 family protein [Actinomycetia bacterium]|nr:DUF4411 family protein [Actinomycetes bacterium]
MYLVDSDVFIDGKNHHYGFDIAPGFWDFLQHAHEQRRVFTVHRCYEEVTDTGDDLSLWMLGRPSTFALKPTGADTPSLQRVSRWAMGLLRRQGVAASWLSTGDYFLVSQALTLGYTVVTHERPAPQSVTKIKIPDACDAMNVPWMSPFEMLRAEGAQFSFTPR